MILSEPRAPEIKAGEAPPTSLDVVEAFDGFMSAFEAFKATNDERLSELESRIGGDPVTAEKLARIDEAVDRQKRLLDELTLKARRPTLETSAGAPGRREHRGAFESYIRRGETGGLKLLEQKALVAGTDAQGGYLVPDETEREIGKKLAEVSPIRGIATVRAVSGAVYRKPVATAGFSSGWVAETASRPQTNTPVLDELAFPAMELYAMPAATQMLLDDSAVDLDRWIAEEVETAFAEQEGIAFVTGDGTAKPRGFLDYDQIANASWAWGNIGFILTGVDGGFPASHPSDKLVDLVYSLRAGYRQNGSFVMNRRTEAAVRKLKDADGNYIWTPPPPAQPHGQAMLMNFPVVEAEAMPDIATDATPIAFGDFRRGYLVVDRIGVRVLRDPYSAKPYVLFYTTKRVGGGVQDFDAIKLLKFGDS